MDDYKLMCAIYEYFNDVSDYRKFAFKITRLFYLIFEALNNELVPMIDRLEAENEK